MRAIAEFVKVAIGSAAHRARSLFFGATGRTFFAPTGLRPIAQRCPPRAGYAGLIAEHAMLPQRGFARRIRRAKPRWGKYGAVSANLG